MSRLGLPFYGLTLSPEDKVRVHQEIFHLCYSSNGAFTHDEVYSMPIYLRYFNMNMLVEQRSRENKAAKDASEDPKSSKSIVKKSF